MPITATAVTVTWPGLLAALGLAATVLVAATTTCFLMYIRPVMKVCGTPYEPYHPVCVQLCCQTGAYDCLQIPYQVATLRRLMAVLCLLAGMQAMAVTLAEMEAAAKEMQQAAQEVEELVGGINSAIKLLMQPTALLKWTSNTASSSSSPASSTDEASTPINTAAGASAVVHESTISMEGSAAAAATAAAAAAGSSSSAAWQMADQLEGLRPGLLEGLKAFQKLQFRGAELGLAGLKLAGLDDEAGRQEKQGRSRVKQAKLSKTAGPVNSSTSMVWDVLASSLSTRATRRSLARLRSDLGAAANVLTVLLAPPSKRLYEQIQAEEQLQQQQPLTGQPATRQSPQLLQQTHTQDMQPQQQPPTSSSRHNHAHAAAAAATTSTGRRSRAGNANGNSASGSGSIKARRAVQLDEWGLPITAAEEAEAAAYEAAAPAAPANSQQPPAASFSPVADSTQQRISSKRQITAAAPAPQQQWQQQQQRLCGSSVDEDSWHLDLSHYGRYLEHEHAAMSDKADCGITWQQLQQGKEPRTIGTCSQVLLLLPVSYEAASRRVSG